ncbi:AER191Wp [Eremothecium gossypii ATCC 10895]|uniref:DNA-directed RNA polymerase III subunit RPC6 n=1 Tax=Eremothecium gossypii (strain ATCC 10895 / CBS 109.51 / FGSC 9923 / NRRL Y-1056) TaxID=284811 RepID=Q756R3_EREGS|nr:AER191Wp [Eremothecium gossypii ATCC 10895]AAS52872.1 AER191Wp [Eremothecium gossypii ATCC 10895]AEY97179.1 FAER191Wp [Eremothecium gossypii FDAG1]
MNSLIQNNIKLSDTAQELHDKMIGMQPGTLFSQQELQAMIGSPSLSNLMAHAQELLDKNLIRLVKQNNELRFQAVNVSEAQKKSGMSSDEALVYSYIEASGREGIWTKTIKAKTNLHQHVVLKCLKSLESQRYVKSVKSVKYPTRKIYMLYNLQPSIDVTGGPWFTDSELDVEFINSLLTIVWRHTSERTYPNGFNNFGTGRDKEVLYTHTVKNYSTTEEILKFISAARVSTVELSKSDIRSLCEVLVYDGKLEKVAFDCYRVTLQSVLQMTQPAGGEPGAGVADQDFSVFDYASVISPSAGDKEAVYIDEWNL